jgi:hypothetical protein
VHTARDVCGTCPLAQECLATGIARQEHGVWGGELLEAGRVIKVRVFRTKPRAMRAGRPAQVIQHGTDAGYRTELRRRLPRCEACKEAHRLYKIGWKMRNGWKAS